MLYINPRGVREGIAIIFFGKSVLGKHPSEQCLAEVNLMSMGSDAVPIFKSQYHLWPIGKENLKDFTLSFSHLKSVEVQSDDSRGSSFTSV